jgi:hypothetical protein
MSEWWTYRLSSFLLFSPRTYYRLFELYNAAIWPAQILTVALGIVCVALLRRGGVARGRLIAGILGTCWLWVGVAFLAERYASINFAATYFAMAFGVEAALLVAIGVVRGRIAFEWPADPAGRVGLAAFLFALLVEPLIGPALGRPWRQVEIFGVAPDPTAVATLGMLLLARVRRRWVLMIVPVLWCVFTGGTLLAMKAPDWWVACATAGISMGFAARQAASRRRALLSRDSSLQ